MRQQQDYFNRQVVDAGMTVWVRLRPRGSELRDLTRGAEIVHWFSTLPGIISIVGWALHHTAFHSRWIVEIEPDAPADVARSARLDPMRKREAEHAFLRLLDWLDEGRPSSQFPDSGTATTVGPPA